MEANALILPHVAAVLDEYAAAVRDLYKRKLLSRDKVTRYSGMLTGTLKAFVSNNGHGFEVSLSLQDYWKYVEGGSKGRLTSPAGAVYKAHWPPTSAILEWIRVKPVAPYPDRKGKLPTERSLAYLIGRKIAFHGIAPAPCLAETLDELNRVYLPRIEAAFDADAAELLDVILEDATPRPFA